MIPWTNFGTGLRTDAPHDIRLRLEEYWLAWIGNGPSMTTVFFDSPMLEIAHERQFVISQQGGDSSNFESEHTKRIDACMKQLTDHFDGFAGEETCRPRSPYAEDLKCCWMPEASIRGPPRLVFLDEVKHVRSLSPESHPASSSVLVTPAEHPYLRTNPLTLATDNDEEDDGDDFDVLPEDWKTTLKRSSKTVTSLSFHSSRAHKKQKQRRRHRQMADKYEDDATAAKRSQSIATQRLHHNPYTSGCDLRRGYEVDET